VIILREFEGKIENKGSKKNILFDSKFNQGFLKHDNRKVVFCGHNTTGYHLIILNIN